ncbi:MAG TPA: hypothetical protein VGN10_17060 [Pyrinomonadaceae bacterium]
MNFCKSFLFHGGDTGSIRVRDAKASRAEALLPILYFSGIGFCEASVLGGPIPLFDDRAFDVDHVRQLANH